MAVVNKREVIDENHTFVSAGHFFIYIVRSFVIKIFPLTKYNIKRHYETTHHN
jgi:hypothetical protein